jgi:hypothetical protein
MIDGLGVFIGRDLLLQRWISWIVYEYSFCKAFDIPRWID